MGLQIRFEGRKADLSMFKDRAKALQGAVTILEEGIAASRAQVGSHTHFQLRQGTILPLNQPHFQLSLHAVLLFMCSSQLLAPQLLKHPLLE